ncbi:Laz1-like protein [Thalictrum thalictroides]|uniref:Laz1-like protein n=1 Tax=Thalictrum thalictroides TaxID=46969 RepID=A0A7J6UUQ1_THATH|nr:Laz1-like protein [Thalictrum thalictroides]
MQDEAAKISAIDLMSTILNGRSAPLDISILVQNREVLMILITSIVVLIGCDFLFVWRRYSSQKSNKTIEPLKPSTVKKEEIEVCDEDIHGMALSFVTYFEATYRDLHSPAAIIAGSFALFALVLSILLIFRHLRSYTNPAEQKWIVAVLFMVPVYASESIISLLNPRLSLACDILRNCYEAFALYSFGSYLVACLGGEDIVERLLENETRKHLSEPFLGEQDENQALQRRPFPYFFRQPHAIGKNLYTIVKFGLVQYMILKTVCAFLAFVLELFGVYGDGEFKWYYGYPYIAAVLNFSQMWALYCLVQFYNVTHERLQPIKPLAKFISFKAIVFATWWQGVGIALLCAIHVLPTEGKFQNGLQDFLICIEMSIAAVAHIFVFSAKPYYYLPISEHGEVISQATKAKMKVDEDGKEKPAKVERMETHVEAPGTSVTESVQDIVIGGGGHVVKDVALTIKDVALTINQAIEPVEKGVTKIQEKIHHIRVDAKDKKEHLEVEEYIEKNVTEAGSGRI